MLLYNLVVQGYGLMIRLAAVKDPKASDWIAGRKNWREALRDKVKNTLDAPLIWVHCASYGEFEQGRPLIDKLKEQYPGHRILLSFFSPSGYNAFKDWKGADIVCYLPLDSRRNAADFLDIVNPAMAVFIKYEFWLHYLQELRKRKVPAYLVSAVFKQHHPFFKWYGSIFRRSLTAFSRLFVQDEVSERLLNSIGIGNTEVCGDTRFDRVLEIRERFQPIADIAAFKGGHRLLIAGSTWPKDEDLVIAAFSQLRNTGLKMLLVPHDIEKKKIADTCRKLSAQGIQYCLYSQGMDAAAEVMVLDTMGMLSRSYYYADAAYIGGGFDTGLHNTLEPAVFGIPVFFYGEDYSKFNEVTGLVKLGAAFQVSDATDLAKRLSTLLGAEHDLNVIKTKISRYFSEQANSTQKILESIMMDLEAKGQAGKIVR